MLSQPEALQLMTKYVRDAGYKAIISDENHIKSFMSGYTVLIFCSPQISNVQFYSGFSKGVNEDFGLQHANAFNELWRYTKCLIKDTGAIGFEADFMIVLDRDDAAASVVEIINVWEATLAAGGKALSGS